LTRQNCGQRSGMAAGGKRRALEFYFCVRICYMFPISKCTEESDLGVCMTRGLAKRMRLSRCRLPIFKRVSPKDSSEFATAQRHYFLRVPKSCKHLDLTLLYISIRGTYSKLVRGNEMLALGVCFPQPCPSAGRRFAASRSRLDYYQTIGLFLQKRIR